MNSRLLLLGISAALSSGLASAQVVDQFGNLATPFTGGVTVNFDTNNCSDTLAPATTSALQNGSCATANNDGWMLWRATLTGPVTVSTCNNANFDTILAAYDGNTPLECNDDAAGCSGFTSSLTFNAVANDVYVIQVGSFGTASWGQGGITFDEMGSPPPLTNDDCFGADNLPQGIPVTFDTTTATTSAPAWPCAGGGGNDIWYTYTAISMQDITVSLCNSQYDTAVEAFAGSCNNLISIGCNDDSCGLQSELTWTPTAVGEMFGIRIGGFNGATGTGEILFTQAPDPSVDPDECSSAINLTLGVAELFDTTSATTSMPWACGSGGNDYWYTFTAPIGGQYSVTTCGSSYDTVLEVFWPVDCAGGNFTSLGCNDDACGLQSILAILGSTGQQFYIRVGGFNGATGAGTILVENHSNPSSQVCNGQPNSTGGGSYLIASGSDVLSGNDVRIDAVAMPTNQFGYFLTSMSTSAGSTPPGSQGLLCLGGAIGRYNNNILNSGATGRYTLFVDNDFIPTPNGTTAASVGETWYFSNWYRDVNPTATSNFSDTIGITYQ